MATSMDPIWEKALTVPCDRCRVQVGEWCRDRDGDLVTKGNGPHSARLDRARGGYSWRELKRRLGDQLMPGPSVDGVIETPGQQARG